MNKRVVASNSPKKRCWFFHKWKVVRNTGVNEYRKCEKCNAKEIRFNPWGYQPVDLEWLEEE